MNFYPGALLNGEEGLDLSNNDSDGVVIRSLGKTGNKKLELNFTISVAQPSAVVAYDPEVSWG